MSIKVGDTVQILHFEKTSRDAPNGTIGLVGKIVDITDSVNTLYKYEVEFFDMITSYYYSWNYTREQIELIKFKKV